MLMFEDKQIGMFDGWLVCFVSLLLLLLAPVELEQPYEYQLDVACCVWLWCALD